MTFSEFLRAEVAKRDADSGRISGHLFKSGDDVYSYLGS